MRLKFEQRYELKYILRYDQAAAIAEEIADYMVPDVYGDDGQGRYTVTSLYYDSADHKAYWDKIDGHRLRRKVRVRVYGDQVVTPHARCFAEIKQRTNKTLQKKRVALPYASAIALHDYDQLLADATDADGAVLQEIHYMYLMLQLRPACVVKYKRVAFNGNQYDPGLRVTFDTNLKYRIHDLSLLSEGYAENRYFLSPKLCVMEIKVNYRIPYWLIQIVGKHNCTLHRVSKYCLALEQGHELLNRQRITL